MTTTDGHQIFKQQGVKIKKPGLENMWKILGFFFHKVKSLGGADEQTKIEQPGKTADKSHKRPEETRLAR